MVLNVRRKVFCKILTGINFVNVVTLMQCSAIHASSETRSKFHHCDAISTHKHNKRILLRNEHTAYFQYVITAVI